ncbi:hypothetical protein [Heyndrickxia coagulans]|uniref:hypothetical protein n=1 Tax=Heyndrickxia coagulans TaxID=1398 RepID=UPI001F410C32|nr:hypothetical protein [Heyndrickxia coagulans]
MGMEHTADRFILMITGHMHVTSRNAFSCRSSCYGGFKSIFFCCRTLYFHFALNTAMCFPWEIFKPIEREYYTLLYLHLKNERAHDPSNEIQPALFSITEEEDKSASSLFHLPSTGRKPHPFMPFFRAFELASLQYIEVMVESVYLQVKSNPLFATMCGFTEKIPSYRSFARFDQIMTTNGLWEKARLLVVEYNKGEGVVETNEEAAAVDTSHIEAEATLNKTRKTCSCEGNCDCPRVLTDDNVGVMRKSNAVSYIAHKLSMVCGVKSGLPLTREVFKGNTPDGKTLEPEPLPKCYTP